MRRLGGNKRLGMPGRTVSLYSEKRQTPRAEYNDYRNRWTRRINLEQLLATAQEHMAKAIGKRREAGCRCHGKCECE